MIKLNKKVATILSVGALMAFAGGIAYAAFVFTFPVNGNMVSAASAGLTVTTNGKPLSGVEYIPGQTTPKGTISITNTASKGALTLEIGNKVGTLCGDIDLVVKDDNSSTVYYSGTVAAAGSIVINSSFSHNASTTVAQTATLDASSTNSGASCTWDETVKLVNN